MRASLPILALLALAPAASGYHYEYRDLDASTTGVIQRSARAFPVSVDVVADDVFAYWYCGSMWLYPETLATLRLVDGERAYETRVQLDGWGDERDPTGSGPYAGFWEIAMNGEGYRGALYLVGGASHEVAVTVGSFTIPSGPDAGPHPVATVGTARFGPSHLPVGGDECFIPPPCNFCVAPAVPVKEK